MQPGNPSLGPQDEGKAGGRKFTVDSLSVNRFRSDKYVLELDLATDLVPVEPRFLVDPRMSSLPPPQDRILSWATETTDEDGTAAGAVNGAKPWQCATMVWEVLSCSSNGEA
jgi:hypothetical protein